MRCKICNHPQRREIENDIKMMKQSDAAKKWNLYPQNIVSHSKHMDFDIRTRLEELIRESLMSHSAPESIGDIARLLAEFRAYTEMEDKCTKCEFKNSKPKLSAREIFNLVLGDDESEMIFISKKEYKLLKESYESSNNK